MIIVSYDAVLVLLSVSVAIIGSFTGLLIMTGIGDLGTASYKLKIVSGAAAIGTSIWSMHFIGMLALGTPIPIGYDTLTTTISVFIAILFTGLGLYSASSGHLTRAALPTGGILMGGGIAGMHYMGMSAIRANCIVSYDAFGVMASIGIGMAASTLALWVTFRERGPLATAAGAVALGLAVSAMHYTAMLATTLTRSDDIVVVADTVLSQHNVAFIVAIATFFICGIFLVIALPDKKRDDGQAENVAADAVAPEARADAKPAEASSFPPGQMRIPVRRNHSTFYAAPGSVLAVRADGHYTWIALRSDEGDIGEHFCERSISVLAKQLAKAPFVRSHRSHLVNIDQVISYRREGDRGVLLLDETGTFCVPVSRSYMHEILNQLEAQVVNELPGAPNPVSS